MLLRSLLVLAGGAAGSLTRYLVGLAVSEHYDGRFPLGTFLINVTGSFLIGILLVIFDREDILHPNLRPLLVTGVLGGYTTFSSFEWETFALGRSSPPMALTYAIAVTDTGAGIAKVDQKKIFEKFVQIAAGEMHVGGTGLGLAIAKALIHLQGGKMWVESELGKGATVYFTIPIFGGKEATPAPKETSAGAGPWWKKLLGIK